MIDFIIPEDGSLEAQDLQYLRVKKGSNLPVEMHFYKDRFKIYPWNLASPVQFNVRAKKLKSLTSYVFNKNKSSSDVILTEAADGQITVILNSIDEAAVITGDKTTFTGIAGDKIKVVVDSITYDNIDISACASIDNVVTAINAAVGAVVASKSSSCLRITSLSSDDNSNVTIADGTSTTQTVVGDLFSVAGDRTDTGRYGDLSIAQSLYMEIEFQPNSSSRIYKPADLILDIIDSVES